ncbi:MAG: NADH-quinone oxidoreductase subunit C [Candidatus Omnitrophica bacterium]|nr:NADH-quinone oxidoreductase subunit C [Candidatus Omnitrophota bacterium]
MSGEEKIKQELIRVLSLSEDKIVIPRERRIFVEVEFGNFSKAFDLCVNTLHFDSLCSLTGLDEGEKLAVMYHLAAADGTILNLRTSVMKSDPRIKSVTGIFSSADVYERELIDLLGFKVEGLAPGNRYPLTDDWPIDEHPLRKDWKMKPRAGK